MARHFSKMVSMARSKEELADARANMPVLSMNPESHPYGLRIILTDAELDKLGMSQECETGDSIHLCCHAVVRSVTRTDDEGGKTCCVTLQIEDMDAGMNPDEDDDDGDEDDEGVRRTTRYGQKKV
jgi:hypothetical protein